ncbi:hypothetical protein HXX76_011098 [Chlamydomonas incerta]|uniref:Nephrocystin 3-like N-terminal domain-containing protein n=1 Tax=Chlamydomonas incerta TaxID=51695 RepID=A0A835SPC8_CHLIN|nr:hypothetical protein HXX76_011098 [Chlamydomonas incerta]|eukprot:KAG2429331.1 hypothetical protein HXX76_011098 [Chlamydomonas incerta]
MTPYKDKLGHWDMNARPCPDHAFAAHWGRDGATRHLSLAQRRQLICLVASSGVLANVQVAVDAAWCSVPPEALAAAAAAGHLEVCWPLVDERCSSGASGCGDGGGGSNAHPPYSPPLHPNVRLQQLARRDPLVAAALAGRPEVCAWLLAQAAEQQGASSTGGAGWRPVSLDLPSATLAAVLGGHAALYRTLLRGRLAAAPGRPEPLPLLPPARLLAALTEAGNAAALMRAVSQLRQQRPLDWVGLRIFISSDDGGSAVLAAAARSTTPDWLDKVDFLRGTECRFSWPHPGSPAHDAVAEAVLLRPGADVRPQLTSRGFWATRSAAGFARWLQQRLMDPTPPAALATKLLVAAAGSGSLELVRLLVEDRHLHHGLGPQVFKAAVRGGGCELVAWLVARGCADGRTLAGILELYTAARRAGDVAMLQQLSDSARGAAGLEQRPGRGRCESRGMPLERALLELLKGASTSRDCKDAEDKGKEVTEGGACIPAAPAPAARSGAVDVVKRQEDVEHSGYSAAMSTAHSRFSLTISRTCTEGPINASNSLHPASRKSNTTTGIVSPGVVPAAAAGGVSPGAGPPGSPTPSSGAGSSAPGSPQSQVPTPGSSPVSPLDLGGPGVAGSGYAGSRGGLHAAAKPPQAQASQGPQQKPVMLPGLPLASAQGLAGAAGVPPPSPFATSSAAAAAGSNGSDLSSSGRAPAPATPPASSAAGGAAAAGFAGGLDSNSSSAGGSPARLPTVPHPVGGFFGSRPGSPAPALAQQAAGSSASASVIATAASGDMQAAEPSGGGAPSGAAAALSAPPRPAWARKLLGEQASGGVSALSSQLSSEAAPGREALSRQGSGLHAGGMLPPILGAPLPLPPAAAALLSSAGSSRLNSSRVLPALGTISTSGVPPVAAAPGAPAPAAAPASPVHAKSVLGPAPPHPAKVVVHGAGHGAAAAAGSAASAPVPVPTPAAAALQGSGQNTPSLSTTPPAAAAAHPAAVASPTSRAEPTAAAASPPHPAAAAAVAAAAAPSLMQRASAPPVLLPTGAGVAAAAAPAAPSLAAAAAALASSPGGGGRGGGVVAPSAASLTAGSRGNRTAGLSAVRGGLVTLAYVEAFLRTHVLGRGPGAGLMTTRQVVEHIIAPACAAAAGCRFPDAPPPAVPSPSGVGAGQGAAHDHAALGLPPRAATSPSAFPGGGGGGGSTSVSGATPGSGTSADSSHGSSHCSGTSSSGAASASDAAAGSSRPVGGPSLHLRDWAACSLPGGGGAAGSAAAAAAAPSGRYCYVVHAADSCFAEVVGLLRSQLAGVPPEEAVLWFDIFALPQEPEPAASAASSPSGAHLAHHHAGFAPGGSGASFSAALPAGRAARVDAARAAIAHAGCVLLCLLPPSAGCPAYATRTTSARHLQLQARLAPALALPGGSEDPAAAGAEAGGLPLPLRRTWCLWELSTALRLRGPSALVVLEGAGCGDGVSAAAPEDGGATCSAAAAFPVPRATCGGGLWLAAGVSRARSLSLARSQLGGTLAPTPQQAADRAALIADMVANTVSPAGAAAAGAAAVAVAAAGGHVAAAGCADLGGCAAADVEAVEAALRLFFALAPTGYGEELAELALRAAPEQAPAARGAPALPGSGPGGSSAAATAGAGVAGAAGGKSCWRFDALWEALSDQAGPRCVVVAAPPGAGKSTFAAALACPPPTPPTAPQPPAWRSVAALHLCHAADGRRQDALRVVRSLAFQLAARFPACRAALAAAMMSASASVSVLSSAQPPSTTQLEDAVEALLVRPLAALAAAAPPPPSQPPPPLILLIDGVDERGPPRGAGLRSQPQPQPPASPSGSELCSPRPPSTPPRVGGGGGGGRPCPIRSPSAAAAAAAAAGAVAAVMPSSPSGNVAAAAAAAAAGSAAAASARGPFPLAPLVTVLLQRLPSHVRLLLTAEQPPKCDASNASPAGAGAATVAAGLDLCPVPDGVASADSVADWLQAGPQAVSGGRRAAAATAAAGSDAAHAASASGPWCRVLPLTALRDDFALAASLHQQLLLRAGPEGALPLTAALLVRGGPRLAFYVTCLRLHALPTLASAPEKLPLTMDAAWEMLFEQEWRAGGGGAVALAEAEKTTARRLLAVLAAAQEPLPVALLSALGLAKALPLLPGWGTGLFVEDLPQRRVRVASGPLAAWLRGGGATTAAAAYGADVAAGHAILAAQLYDMCGRAAVADGSGSGAAPAAALLPGAIAAYAARHLHTHLAAAIALAPASPQLQQLQQKLQQLEQQAQQQLLPASTSGRLRLTLPADGGTAPAPRSAAAAASSTPAPTAAGPVAALRQAGAAQQQPLPSLSQLDAWAAHLGMAADTPRTSLAGSTRKPQQEPPRGPLAAIAV